MSERSSKEEKIYNDPCCTKCNKYFNLNYPLFLSLKNKYNYLNNIPNQLCLCDEHLEEFFYECDLNFKRFILKLQSSRTSSSSNLTSETFQENVIQNLQQNKNINFPLNIRFLESNF